MTTYAIAPKGHTGIINTFGEHDISSLIFQPIVPELIFIY